MNNSCLLDVNVLIALAWPNHQHHPLVKKWFMESGKKNWASCPVTQSGFIRISSNPGIIESAVSPEAALKLLKALIGTGHHSFWTNSVDITGIEIPPELFQGHRQITDFYLLTLAAENEGKLTTLDRKLFESAKGSRFERNLLFLW